jgi:hypothetical protein
MHEAIEFAALNAPEMSSTVISSLRKTVHLGAQFAEVLHDVVGEAVVVVDHQEFHDLGPHVRDAISQYQHPGQI